MVSLSQKKGHLINWAKVIESTAKEKAHIDKVFKGWAIRYNEEGNNK
jgi:hypothetical protein